jgi:urease accessory protein
VLRHGALLRTSEGSTIRIQAAAEPLSVVSRSDPTALARAAYHLGNRHVPLQIGHSSLCYRQDHVLDDMLRGLGLTPEHAERPFEPEQGAYAQGAHGAHSHHGSPSAERSHDGHDHDSDHEH